MEEEGNKAEMNLNEWIESSPYHGIIVGVVLSTTVFCVFLVLSLWLHSVRNPQTHQPGKSGAKSIGQKNKSSLTCIRLLDSALGNCKVRTNYAENLTESNNVSPIPNRNQQRSMEPQHKKEEKELGNLCVIQSTESLMCRQSQLKTGSIKCSCCSRKAEKKSQANDQVVLASLSTDEKMRRRYSTPRSLKSSDFTSSSSHERTSPPRTKRHSVPAPAKRPLVQDDDARIAHNNTRKSSDDGCVWKLILPKDDSFRLNITCTKLDGSIEAKSTLHKSVETFMSQSFLANEAGYTQRSAHRFLANEAGSAESQRSAHRFLANEAGSAQSQRSAHRFLANEARSAQSQRSAHRFLAYEAGSAQSQRSAHRYLANKAGSAQSQRSAHRYLANEAGSAQRSAHRFLRNKDKKDSNIDKNLGNPKYKNVQRDSEEVMKPHRSPSELTDYKVNESWANLDVFSEPQKFTVPVSGNSSLRRKNGQPRQQHQKTLTEKNTEPNLLDESKRLVSRKSSSNVESDQNVASKINKQNESMITLTEKSREMSSIINRSPSPHQCLSSSSWSDADENIYLDKPGQSVVPIKEDKSGRPLSNKTQDDSRSRQRVEQSVSPYIQNGQRVMKSSTLKSRSKPVRPLNCPMLNALQKSYSISQGSVKSETSSKQVETYHAVYPEHKGEPLEPLVFRKRKRQIPKLIPGSGKRDELYALGKTSNAVQSSTSSDDNSLMSLKLFQNSNKKQSDEHLRITFRPCSAAKLTSQPVPTFTLHKSYLGLQSHTNQNSDKVLTTAKPTRKRKGQWKSNTNENQQTGANIFDCTAELRKIIEVTMKDLERYNPPESTKIGTNIDSKETRGKEGTIKKPQDTLMFGQINNSKRKNENTVRRECLAFSDMSCKSRLSLCHNYSQMNECSHAQTASTSTDPLSQSMPRRSSRIDKKSSSSKCGAKLKIGLKTMNDIPVGVMSLSADSNDGAATSKSQESGCCLSEPTVHKSPGFYLIEESVDWSFPIQKILSDDNLVCFQGDQTPHFQTCLKHKSMDVTEDSSDLSTNYYKDNCKNKECSVEDSERNLDLPLNQAVELFSILKHKAKRLYATSSGELCPKHTRHKSRRSEFGPGGNDSTSNGSVTVCESRKQRHIALNLCARQPSENESPLSDCYNCSTKSVTSTTPSSSDSVTKLPDASWRSGQYRRQRSSVFSNIVTTPSCDVTKRVFQNRNGSPCFPEPTNTMRSSPFNELSSREYDLKWQIGQRGRQTFKKLGQCISVNSIGYRSKKNLKKYTQKNSNYKRSSCSGDTFLKDTFRRWSNMNRDTVDGHITLPIKESCAFGLRSDDELSHETRSVSAIKVCASKNQNASLRAALHRSRNCSRFLSTAKNNLTHSDHRFGDIRGCFYYNKCNRSPFRGMANKIEIRSSKNSTGRSVKCITQKHRVYKTKNTRKTNRLENKIRDALQASKNYSKDKIQCDPVFPVTSEQSSSEVFNSTSSQNSELSYSFETNHAQELPALPKFYENHKTKNEDSTSYEISGISDKVSLEVFPGSVMSSGTIVQRYTSSIENFLKRKSSKNTSPKARFSPSAKNMKYPKKYKSSSETNISEYSIRSRSCSDTDFLKLVTLKEKSKLDKGDYGDDKIGSKGNFVFSKQLKYSANCQSSLEKETLREVLNQEINCPIGRGHINKHTVQKKMRVNVKAAKKSASLESSLDLYVVEKDLTRDVFIAKKEREPTKVISLEDDLAQGESTSSPKHKMPKTAVGLNAEQVSYMEILPKQGKFRGLRLSEIERPPMTDTDTERKNTKLRKRKHCFLRSSSHVLNDLTLPQKPPVSKRPSPCSDNIGGALNNNDELDTARRPRLCDAEMCAKSHPSDCLQHDKKINKLLPKISSVETDLSSREEKNKKAAPRNTDCHLSQSYEQDNQQRDDGHRHRPDRRTRSSYRQDLEGSPTNHCKNKRSIGDDKNIKPKNIKEPLISLQNTHKKEPILKTRDYYSSVTKRPQKQFSNGQTFSISTSSASGDRDSRAETNKKVRPPEKVAKSATMHCGVQTSFSMSKPVANEDKDTLVIFPEPCNQSLKIDNVCQTDVNSLPEMVDKHIQCPTLGSQVAVELMDLLTLIKTGKSYYERTNLQTMKAPQLDPNDGVVLSGCRLDGQNLGLDQCRDKVPETEKVKTSRKTSLDKTVTPKRETEHYDKIWKDKFGVRLESKKLDLAESGETNVEINKHVEKNVRKFTGSLADVTDSQIQQEAVLNQSVQRSRFGYVYKIPFKPTDQSVELSNVPEQNQKQNPGQETELSIEKAARDIKTTEQLLYPEQCLDYQAQPDVKPTKQNWRYSSDSKNYQDMLANQTQDAARRPPCWDWPLEPKCHKFRDELNKTKGCNNENLTNRPPHRDTTEMEISHALEEHGFGSKQLPCLHDPTPKESNKQSDNRQVKQNGHSEKKNKSDFKSKNPNEIYLRKESNKDFSSKQLDQHNVVAASGDNNLISAKSMLSKAFQKGDKLNDSGTIQKHDTTSHKKTLISLEQLKEDAHIHNVSEPEQNRDLGLNDFKAKLWQNKAKPNVQSHGYTSVLSKQNLKDTSLNIIGTPKVFPGHQNSACTKAGTPQRNNKAEREIKIQINLNMTNSRKRKNPDTLEKQKENSPCKSQELIKSQSINRNCKLPLSQRVSRRNNYREKLRLQAQNTSYGKLNSHASDHLKAGAHSPSTSADKRQDYNEKPEHVHSAKDSQPTSKRNVSKGEQTDATDMKDKVVMTSQLEDPPIVCHSKKTDIYNTLLSALLVALQAPNNQQQRSEHTGSTILCPCPLQEQAFISQFKHSPYDSIQRFIETTQKTSQLAAIRSKILQQNRQRLRSDDLKQSETENRSTLEKEEHSKFRNQNDIRPPQNIKSTRSQRKSKIPVKKPGPKKILSQDEEKLVCNEYTLQRDGRTVPKRPYKRYPLTKGRGNAADQTFNTQIEEADKELTPTHRKKEVQLNKKLDSAGFKRQKKNSQGVTDFVINTKNSKSNLCLKSVDHEGDGKGLIPNEHTFQLEKGRITAKCKKLQSPIGINLTDDYDNQRITNKTAKELRPLVQTDARFNYLIALSKRSNVRKKNREDTFENHADDLQSHKRANMEKENQQVETQSKPVRSDQPRKLEKLHHRKSLESSVHYFEMNHRKDFEKEILTYLQALNTSDQNVQHYYPNECHDERDHVYIKPPHKPTKLSHKPTKSSHKPTKSSHKPTNVREDTHTTLSDDSCKLPRRKMTKREVGGTQKCNETLIREEVHPTFSDDSLKLHNRHITKRQDGVQKRKQTDVREEPHPTLSDQSLWLLHRKMTTREDELHNATSKMSPYRQSRRFTKSTFPFSTVSSPPSKPHNTLPLQNYSSLTTGHLFLDTSNDVSATKVFEPAGSLPKAPDKARQPIKSHHKMQTSRIQKTGQTARQ
ncbi:hypothetical protein BgiBS90_031531 [Biomphalaria glabrata]|nr:hypothetical protein BgiBS90_031531 [Biomphalaria glabrata]